MNFALTNARFLASKADSLVENFCELDLGFMLVTESWLKKGVTLPRNLTDLEHAENLKLIHKSRKSRRGRTAGGGVCLVYDRTKISFKQFPIKTGQSEVVAAVGKIQNIQRKLVVITAYISPKTRAKQSHDTLY